MGDFMDKFLDSATVTGVKITTEGYLVADAFTARTGIQTYAGYEVGRPELSAVKVLRPADEVFHKDALKSFSHIPVTDDHPTQAVDSKNWNQLARGETGDEVLRDGERLRIPLIVKDAATVQKINGGKRELSVGYGCTLDWTAGVTADGQSYDAVQREIRANHIAVVDRGRAGPEFRIGDDAGKWGAAPIVKDQREHPMATRNIMFDGISIEVTDQAAQAIEKLQNQLRDSTVNIETLRTTHATELSVKDGKIGELSVKLADAEKKVPTPEALNRMIADRLALVDTAAKAVPDLKVEALSDEDIRREVVKAKYGEDMVKDASNDTIAGMFKVIAADTSKVNNDPVRQALMGDKRAPVQLGDNGQAGYETRLQDAWKQPVSASA